MAGIGFSLRKVLKDESSYATRVHAWFHTAIVSAGPWIISIVTINIVLAFSKRWNLPYAERELLIATIIYSTLFSQILTAPFQMIITRYIADRIYSEEYAYIKPSFWGSSSLISLLSLVCSVLFYANRDLPLEYQYLAVSLSVVLSILWMLIVYQSTLKNFKLITMSNLLGTFITFALILFFADNPLDFNRFRGASNLLMAYTGGIVFFTIFLLIAFLTEMKEDNGKVFHFIRYFHSVPSLWPIGLFYTLAIWVDNIIMWFSPISVNLFGIFRYAPFYDVATFYAYLTILPSVMLFMVLIETDFYIRCREFYLAILKNGPLSELKVFATRMWDSLQRNILQTFEIQLFITLVIIVLSRTIFPVFGVPEEARQIFVIYALGAFCNGFILIFLQVLLYIGERNRALLLVVAFFVTNVIGTLLSLQWGERFYGFGFFISSFLTMLLGLYLTIISYKRVIKHTYMTQPVYTRSKEKTFERLEEWIDERMNNQDALDKLYLEKRKDRFVLETSASDLVDGQANREDLPAFGVQEQQRREAEKDLEVILSMTEGYQQKQEEEEDGIETFSGIIIDESEPVSDELVPYTPEETEEELPDISESLRSVLEPYLKATDPKPAGKRPVRTKRNKPTTDTNNVVDYDDFLG